jgi:hypothetical protein
MNYGGSGYSFLGSEIVPGDTASTEIRAAGAFDAGVIQWSSGIDMQPYAGGVAVWIVITALGGNTSVQVYAEWSDDGTTIVYDGTAQQKSDDSIVNGAYTGYNYVATLSTATSTLTTGKPHFWFPRTGGNIRIGVRGDNSSGSYSIRALRFA